MFTYRKNHKLVKYFTLILMPVFYLTACNPNQLNLQSESWKSGSQSVERKPLLAPNAEGLYLAPEEAPTQPLNDTLEVNGNVPYFSNADLILTEPYHHNEPLDYLGRVGEANTLIGPESMPAEDRSSISHLEPTGWNQARYANIGAGGWLYNRSHLIAYQLTGVDAFENLMTGTRWFNEEMIAYENFVSYYIEKTDNHVRFRVTPIFLEDNLLAHGAYMEGFSIEDNGEGLMFNIYIPNQQEGVLIDYQTGESRGMEGPVQDGDLPSFEGDRQDETSDDTDQALIKGNINSSGEKIYHKPKDPHYDRTVIDEEAGERWFKTEEEAQAAGWRPAK